MTIRVSIPQKHNIIRKTYNKQAGAPAPAPLTISLFHSTPPQALPPGSPAPSHPHTSRTTHHSVPQPSHESPAPYRIDADGGDSGEEAEPRHAVQGDADVPTAFEECKG